MYTEKSSEDLKKGPVDNESLSGLEFPDGFKELTSEAMQQVYSDIKKITQFDRLTALISGSTGVGKEIAVLLIHYNGFRSEKPFIPVNCAGLGNDLLHSTLFGHKRGSYTDAKEDREGLFASVTGGIVFLDEIAEMPLPCQANLLRVIEEQKIQPLGEDHQRDVDVQIIAATNVNLEERVKSGAFREDLYSRLNVHTIKILDLSDHREDIPDLCEHFCEYFCKRFKEERNIKRIAIEEKALTYLQNLNWPGNIRELKNIIERIIVKNQIKKELTITCEMAEKAISSPKAKLSKGTPKRLWLPDNIWEEILKKSPKLNNDPPLSNPRLTLSAYCCKERYNYSWKEVGAAYNSNEGATSSTYSRLLQNIAGERGEVEDLLKNYAKYGNMKCVDANYFAMGSNDEHTSIDDDDAKPVHKVYLDQFFIDPCVVTNREYREFVLDNPDWNKSGSKSREFCDKDYLRYWTGDASFPEQQADHPVVYVSWYAAMAYAEWMGKRLPTEAEWEYAARGTLVNEIYPWGSTIDHNKARYRDKAIAKNLAPAYSYKPNKYDLYNMAGNVWEWCLDDYDPNFYKGKDKEEPERNPLCLEQGQDLRWLIKNFTSTDKFSHAISRGGGYADWYFALRVCHRNANSRTLCNMSLGVRCVYDENYCDKDIFRLRLP